MNTLNRKERVIVDELVRKYGQDELLEAINFRNVLPYVAAAGLTLGGLHGISHPTHNRIDKENKIEQSAPSNEYGMSDDDYKLFLKKVKSAKDLMSNVLQMNGKSIDDVRFNIDNAVYLCYKHNYDLPLMLAQMQCESHFGTTPRAIRTGSVFSVGQWDRKTVSRYKTQDDCFEPYINLMKNDYLQNGKVSVDQLLRPGCFVNHLGLRFASNPKYERNIRVTRNKIMQNYPDLAEDYTTYNI